MGVKVSKLLHWPVSGGRVYTAGVSAQPKDLIAPDRFPVWIWMDDPCFYGFPTYGEAGPKAAQDCGGSPVDKEQMERRQRVKVSTEPEAWLRTPGLLRLAFKGDRLIDSLNHPVLRELAGEM
jgi:hypothetical protein